MSAKGFSILLLVCAAAGCGTRSASTAIPQPRDAFSQQNEAAAFEGVVLERLPSPGFWAGFFSSFQGIRYKVTRVLAGPVTDGEIVVYHVLVGPPLCEKDEPVLSKAIFKVGNRLRVKAERTPAGDYVSWEQASNVTVLREG